MRLKRKRVVALYGKGTGEGARASLGRVRLRRRLRSLSGKGGALTLVLPLRGQDLHTPAPVAAE